jgi:hypothetical protein
LLAKSNLYLTMILRWACCTMCCGTCSRIIVRHFYPSVTEVSRRACCTIAHERAAAHFVVVILATFYLSLTSYMIKYARYGVCVLWATSNLSLSIPRWANAMSYMCLLWCIYSCFQPHSTCLVQISVREAVVWMPSSHSCACIDVVLEVFMTQQIFPELPFCFFFFFFSACQSQKR